MRRIAFVFSGQGDQKSGMGKDLYDSFPKAAEIFDTLDKLSPGLKDMCFLGTDEELKETKNAQKCLYAYEMAAAGVLKDLEISPSSLAGFSLGEVSAAAFSGIFSLEEGFSLVTKRGLFMQEASEENETFMAAVLKLSNNEVENICMKFDNTYPVNFNCPGQVSVSGLLENKEPFFKACKEAGGRAVPINVKGAFHSPFMNEASYKFGKELEDTVIKAPKTKLYSNITGEIYKDNIKEALALQINHPVLWEKTVNNMISDGIDTFIEIGPGKTLSNMINKIDKSVETYRSSDIEEILEKVKTC